MCTYLTKYHRKSQYIKSIIKKKTYMKKSRISHTDHSNDSNVNRLPFYFFLLTTLVLLACSVSFLQLFPIIA